MISAGVPLELAAELQAFLAESGRSADEVIEAALRDYLDEATFEASVAEADAAIARGDFVTHEELVAELRAMLAAKARD